jgi:hypothetical protein
LNLPAAIFFIAKRPFDHGHYTIVITSAFIEAGSGHPRISRGKSKGRPLPHLPSLL